MDLYTVGRIGNPTSWSGLPWDDIGDGRSRWERNLRWNPSSAISADLTNCVYPAPPPLPHDLSVGLIHNTLWQMRSTSSALQTFETEHWSGLLSTTCAPWVTSELWMMSVDISNQCRNSKAFGKDKIVVLAINSAHTLYSYNEQQQSFGGIFKVIAKGRQMCYDWASWSSGL